MFMNPLEIHKIACNFHFETPEKVENPLVTNNVGKIYMTDIVYGKWLFPLASAPQQLS